ncbi:MAG: sirohydrochlorin chelatase [Spirochaetia bacterium]|nr:sirohydrochlorin chelatase [Spirochaetia bacterium]
MRYILFVGHGSRDEDGNEEVRTFVRGLVKKKNYLHSEVCFLEFGKPDIITGIENCVVKGASEIIVIPIILLPAGHSKIHIPLAIDQGKLKYPNVKFYYGTPVGTDLAILEILNQRMENIWNEPSNGIRPALKETSVLLLGRGSSDADANSTLVRIARLFWEHQQEFQMVETAFMGITQPLMKEGLDRCRLLGAKHIVILPYFLFTGILIERMKKYTEDYAKEYPEIKIQLADYFGFHPLLEEIVARRIKEAIAGQSQLNCDLCKYRIDAENNHHHHHHEHTHSHTHTH